MILICLLLIAVTALVYVQGINHDFLNFDDDLYVTDNPEVQNGLSLQSVKWASAVCAFLFAIHPLHVESVAWIAERKDRVFRA